jgi:Family of unknown function (DUF6121)
VSPYRRYAAIVAIFGAGLYLALVIGSFGMISAVFNRDVIPEPEAGPLIGPMMIGAAALTVLIGLLVLGQEVPEEKVRIRVIASLIIGAAAYIVFLLVGALLFAAGLGQPFAFFPFLMTQIVNLFSFVLGVLAIITALLYQLVLMARPYGRPRWPWERRR